MNAEQKKKYNYWQWRTLIILMIGYVLYYFVRKNFSAALPAMQEDLGITKLQLGIFITLNGIVYGFSRFINGFIADRTSRRKLMAAGLALSGIINFAICFSPAMNSFINVLDTQGKATMTLVYIIGGLWVINGYVHGMGFPPCASLMAHWIRPSELATKQSIWNSSHSIGAGLVVALCGALLSKFGMSAWNLCFAVPLQSSSSVCVIPRRQSVFLKSRNWRERRGQQCSLHRRMENSSKANSSRLSSERWSSGTLLSGYLQWPISVSM